MKRRWFLLIGMLVLHTTAVQLQANPFACQLRLQKPNKPEKQPVTLSYVGFADFEQQRFAIIQIRNNQFILKQGESVNRIKIVRFSADSLVYQDRDNLISIPISSGRP